MTTTSVDAPAVRYEKDADGIVTLTLDDPNASANTMNEAYRDGMHAAVDRLYDELAADESSVTGVVVASAKKTFFAGGNLRLMIQATPGGRAAVLRRGREHQGRPASPREAAEAGRGRDQRSRARRWVRDHARLPAPDPRRRPPGRDRPARGVPRAAARWRRRHARDPDARHPVGADGRAAPGPALQAGRRAEEGARPRAGGHPRGAGPCRQAVDPRPPRRRVGGVQRLGPPGLQDARRHAQVARPWPRSSRRSRRCCASRPRARTTPPSGRSSRPWSRARASTSTPRRGSSRAT